MSYVDAIFDRDRDCIHVVERVNGRREFREYPANYVFYYDDPRGKFKSIYGNSVSRFSSRSGKEFHKELKMHSGKQLYESDINQVFRCFEDHYKGVDAPKLNTCFFDIEVDFDQERGYAPTDDPFNKITAISLYLDWTKQLICLALPPSGMSMETAEDLVAEFENTYLFEREEDMLKVFLDLIDDADVLSGWNSEGFDIPYTVLRITRILSKDDTRKFCLWGQLPKKRMFERFGAENITFDTVGRVHLDYMQLYRKYTYEERHSYALDAIGEHELGERKVAYEGTLDQLYNKDFKKFIDYNRQDTYLLARLDEKLKFLDLANTLAHENTVLLPTTMGAVAVTEQAIINEAHERGLVVPNRKQHEGSTAAAGAYVAYPKKGIHEWVGSVDINSLYPSAIRALNMAPETIVGQLRPVLTDHLIEERMGKKMSFAAAWEGLFGSLEYTKVMEQDRATELYVDWEDGTTSKHTGAEMWKAIFDNNQPWTISANGTIFTYEKEGVVPGLLKRWYAERKVMQKTLKEAINEGDADKIEYWDKRQLVKKINLNSLYGAILNPGCRFFDKRIGQSTTLTGRSIAKHMDAHINECITGEYDHVGKAIIYGDTDSAYFSAWPMVKDDVEAGKMEWNTDIAIGLYDSIAEQVNISFPAFMETAFHCPREMGEIIKGGREIVANRGLFITKKRYAVNVVDNEGKRTDVDGKTGKIKAMGLDLKRSDTPKEVQEFLLEILTKVLNGATREQIIERIIEYKEEFITKPAWTKGTPKRVNNLTKFTEAEKAKGKANMPGHVRAAINWNELKRMNGDNYSMKIIDGQKTIVCKLKPNALGWTSIGYPTDELHLPQWFTELPFDDELMESVIVDQKIENLLGVLDWDLTGNIQIRNTFNQLFEF